MKYLFITLLLLVTQHLFSQTGGETVYKFLNTPTSAKQVALGGHILTSQNDVSQVLWNPAAANSKIDGDVALNFVNYIADIKVGSLVYAKTILKKYGTAFVGIQYLDYGDFDQTDISGPDVLGTFTSRDLSFNLGYAYQYQQISIGASLKYVSSKIDVYNSTALLYDFGLTYFHPRLPFIASISFLNSGSQLNSYKNTKESVAKNVTIACEYTLEHVPLRFYGALDDLGNWNISVPNPSKQKNEINGDVVPQKINKVENAFRHVSLGAELWPEKKFNIRIAYNNRRAQEFQLKEARTNAGLSYGFGINTKWLKFDYAFAKFQEGAKYSTFGLTLHL